MVDVQLRAYNKQHGLKGCCLIPGNMFGESDNYNLKDGHVIPSLIHKFYNAKTYDEPVVIWGDGSSYREFLYAKDVAKIAIDLLDSKVLPELMIVSGKQEYTIRSIVNKIAKIYKYNNIEWDITKPNGQLRRPTNKTVFNSVFPNFEFTDLDVALWQSIEWFRDNYRSPSLRL
jgi:GDP-L-fucose synthase